MKRETIIKNAKFIYDDEKDFGWVKVKYDNSFNVSKYFKKIPTKARRLIPIAGYLAIMAIIALFIFVLTSMDLFASLSYATKGFLIGFPVVTFLTMGTAFTMFAVIRDGWDEDDYNEMCDDYDEIRKILDIESEKDAIERIDISDNNEILVLYKNKFKKKPGVMMFDTINKNSFIKEYDPHARIEINLINGTVDFNNSIVLD